MSEQTDHLAVPRQCGASTKPNAASRRRVHTISQLCKKSPRWGSEFSFVNGQTAPREVSMFSKPFADTNSLLSGAVVTASDKTDLVCELQVGRWGWRPWSLLLGEGSNTINLASPHKRGIQTLRVHTAQRLQPRGLTESRAYRQRTSTQLSLPPSPPCCAGHSHCFPVQRPPNSSLLCPKLLRHAA